MLLLLLRLGRLHLVGDASRFFLEEFLLIIIASFLLDQLFDENVFRLLDGRRGFHDPLRIQGIRFDFF